MFVLAVGSQLVTRKLSTGLQRSRWQNLLEIVVTAINKQIGEVGMRQPEKYLGFLGTLVPVCRDGKPLHYRSRL